MIALNGPRDEPGEPVERYRISMAQTTDPTADGAPWAVRKHRQRRQVDVLVGAKLKECDDESLEALFATVTRDGLLLGAESSSEDFMFKLYPATTHNIIGESLYTSIIG
jgi:hypothetical protein